MRRIARLLTVVASPLLAAGLTAAPAHAADPIKAGLIVRTDATFAATSLSMTGTG